MAAELKENFDGLYRALEIMKYSLNKCKEIGIKEAYPLTELDTFENLTSRFARTSDIYTQKIMKGITLISREDAETFLDRANLFEKLNIASADELKMIRDLRNEIAHEYRLTDISEIFEAVLEYSDILLKIIEKTNRFAQEKGWVEKNNATSAV